MRSSAVWCVLAACGGPTAEHVSGSPSDIRIREGGREGFEVHLKCKSPVMSGAVSVIGTGRRQFPFLENGPGPDGDYSPALREQFREDATAAASARSLRGTGFGASCAGEGPAFLLWLGDYGEVDLVLWRLGTWMARKGLRGEIVVDVMGPIVPL
jgi:hypothetical protein